MALFIASPLGQIDGVYLAQVGQGVASGLVLTRYARQFQGACRFLQPPEVSPTSPASWQFRQVNTGHAIFFAAIFDAHAGIDRQPEIGRAHV